MIPDPNNLAAWFERMAEFYRRQMSAYRARQQAKATNGARSRAASRAAHIASKRTEEMMRGKK